MAITTVFNVNPGLINPTRLFSWEGTIKKYKKVSDEITIGGVLPELIWLVVVEHVLFLHLLGMS